MGETLLNIVVGIKTNSETEAKRLESALGELPYRGNYAQIFKDRGETNETDYVVGIPIVSANRGVAEKLILNSYQENMIVFLKK